MASVGHRFIGLLRSGIDPDRRAVGHWTVGDVAAHVSHVFAFDVLSASGVSSIEEADLPDFIDASALPASLEEVGDFDTVNRTNEALVRRDQERSLDVLAGRIEQSLEALIDILIPGDEGRVITWLAGARLPLVAVAGHVLFELVCHGVDVARATKRPWKIEPTHVPLIFDSFVGTFMENAPRIATAVMGETRSPVCIELRLRGQGRSHLVVDAQGAHIERGNGRAADLHVSADPVTFLLLMAGRTGRMRSALSGRVVAWGRHPLRGFQTLSRLRAP